MCSPTSYELIEINGSKVSSVRIMKLLGVNFQDNLKWHNHFSETIKKAFKRLYFLTQLTRAKVPSSVLAKFYVACLQSVLLYECQVYHCSIPNWYDNVEILSNAALHRINVENKFQPPINEKNILSYGVDDSDIHKLYNWPF